MKKRYLAFVLSIALVCATALPVFAAEEDSDAQAAALAADSAENEEGPEPEGDPEPEELAGITLSQSDLSIYTRTQNAQLTVTLEPAGAAYDDIIWESADPAVAAVAAEEEDPATAVVTAAADGSTEVTVTVTSGEETYVADCAVTVSFYNGLNRDPDSDNAYYYVDGEIDTSITEVLWSTLDDKSGWWNIVAGEVVGSTVVKNENEWWYINADGMADFSYNGFAENSNGSWYCENGKVTFQKQDILKDTTGALGEKDAWYYVIGSKVQTGFTGLGNFRNTYGWWYIKNGKVDFTHNGVDKNKNGWFYVTGGKVQFGFTGLGNYGNSNGWWYIKFGKVDFSHNGVDKNKNGWWYVTGGKVQFGYTGVANHKNANGWWYVKNGKVDFAYSGRGDNKNGIWYVKNGKVQFIKGMAAGSNGTTYYFTSPGVKTGWISVNGGYYYFDRDTGVMQAGKAVDGISLSSSGKANASANDVIKIKTMIKARDRMQSLTNTSDSQAVKLRKCFDWLVGNYYSRTRYLSQEKSKSPTTWTCVYANDEFDNKKGDCISEACAFAYMAKECGYTAYVCDDTGHSWCEINGLVYDPDLARSRGYTNYYGATYEAAGLSGPNKTAV